MSENMLPLTETITALRDEIASAAAAGADSDLRFQLGTIELEFTVVAKREGGPNGAIKFSVLGIGAEVGGSAKFANERTHKVKLSLTPAQRFEDGSTGHVEIKRSLPPKGQVPLNRKP